MNLLRRYPLYLMTLLLCGGCGSGRVAVSGTVVYDDGAPVPEGTVCGELMEGGTDTVQGVIRNGAFSLGTLRPGDGVKPGKYKILIQCRGLGDAEKAAGKQPAIAGKYGAYDTSGLTLEVTAARRDVVFTVAQPGKGSS